MRKKYFYNVTLKDAVSKEERTILVKETSMLNAVLSTDEIKNTYEHISKIVMIEL
jgi:hypothetical protein